HGPHLSGGPIPGAPPSWPPAANLTPGEGSAMLRYPSADAFIAMLKSGRRPDGSEVSKVMPFAGLGQLSEADATALYVHLKRLAPLAAGNRWRAPPRPTTAAGVAVADPQRATCRRRPERAQAARGRP